MDFSGKIFLKNYTAVNIRFNSKTGSTRHWTSLSFNRYLVFMDPSAPPTHAMEVGGRLGGIWDT